MSMSIDLNGAWDQYVKAIPEGAHVIGVLSHSSGKEGALVQFERSGVYVLVTGDSASTLDQEKVIATLWALATG